MSADNVKVYASIDTTDIDRARDLARIAAAQPGAGVKLGIEFFMSNGPEGVRRVREVAPDASFFLDLKLHDIPNTVAAGIRTVSTLGIDYVNVHASGGTEMMSRANEAAQEGAVKAGLPPPKVIGVTVLTSLDNDMLNDVGQSAGAASQVVRLTMLTREAGLAGVVCSAHEIAPLRRDIGKDFVLIVPGIRPAGSDLNDQKRVMTPVEAIREGATHLVIGRPITQAADPAKALEDILKTL